ncbi:DUF3306 domain-containing protein [Hydrogenophaga bisanensis]|uniref:DUF3306 domain-containing protein n=1 Tax=Hydrogenophaga bisanensis TaxID=439611 RepID=A0ABW2R6G9_9BURK
MSSEDNGFLSRWSRRKALVRSGQSLPPEPPPPEPEAPVPVSAQAQPGSAHAEVSEPVVNHPAEQPAPTLDDVADLTPQSDFRPFVARHVPADVRNAAVKKLFADPHFNVMDGLDIYIDDYTKSEPIPADMLAKMVGAQFLKLVDEPTATEAPAPLAQPEPVAPPTEQPQEAHDDHPDLQLQPDHAPGSQSPGAGAG